MHLETRSITISTRLRVTKQVTERYKNIFKIKLPQYEKTLSETFPTCNEWQTSASLVSRVESLSNLQNRLWEVEINQIVSSSDDSYVYKKILGYEPSKF